MSIHITHPVTMTFIHLEKAGGSSINKWFYDNIDHQYITRFGKHGPLQKARRKFQDVGFTFAVVRNPFAREVSWYFHLKEKMKSKIERHYGKGVTNENKDVKQFEKIYELVTTLDFKDFLINHSTLTPQAPRIDGIDCVIKLENIQEEFKIIQEKLNIDDPLPHVNKSNHSHYRDYYNEESIDFVYKKYKIDFDLYHYTF